jgi:threonine/homoserine/homoserine lactone efflux protein
MDLGLQSLGLFAGATIAVNLTPGPDMLLVVERASRRGFAAAAAAATGVGTGCLVHTAAVAAGLSALIAASPAALTAIRALGASYLLYLGLRLLFGRAGAAADPVRASRRGDFTTGLLTNLTNPKVVLFFAAFLPQFVAASAPAPWLSLATLGLGFDASGVTCLLAIAAVAAHARVRAASRAVVLQRWLGRALGAAFVATAVRLAWSGGLSR